LLQAKVLGYVSGKPARNHQEISKMRNPKRYTVRVKGSNWTLPCGEDASSMAEARQTVCKEKYEQARFAAEVHDLFNYVYLIVDNQTKRTVEVY